VGCIIDEVNKTKRACFYQWPDSTIRWNSLTVSKSYTTVILQAEMVSPSPVDLSSVLLLNDTAMGCAGCALYAVHKGPGGQKLSDRRSTVCFLLAEGYMYTLYSVGTH